MFIDIHEMGGTEYFFPPNADPYYHEVSNASVGYLDLYGGAMAEEFDRQGIPYFTGRTFDLFYAGYGDTFPTLGWNGAGMSALSCPTLLAFSCTSQWCSRSFRTRLSLALRREGLQPVPCELDEHLDSGGATPTRAG